MLNERTEKTLHNQAQITSTLSENASRLHALQDSVHALGDKLQQHVASSAEVAYANVSRSKKSSDDEEEHSPATSAAIDALRAVCTSSLERIKDVSTFFLGELFSQVVDRREAESGCSATRIPCIGSR